MITLKTIFLTLLVSNFFAVFFIGYHFYISQDQEKLVAPMKLLDTNPYKFDEPLTAFYILEQLDVFEPVDDKYYNNFPKVMNQYSKPHLGLKTDPTYCRRHRAYFADHPEFIFETKNFMTDHAPGSLVREKALKAVGNDVQPKIGAHMSPSLKEKFFFDIKPEINLFFFNQGLHTYKHVGKNTPVPLKFTTIFPDVPLSIEKITLLSLSSNMPSNSKEDLNVSTMTSSSPRLGCCAMKINAGTFLKNSTVLNILKKRPTRLLYILERLVLVPIKLQEFNL